jgi:glycosyltransferase involved in cell wall biosynthesis
MNTVQFVLVGEGAFREQYMKEAAAMGLNNHVTWTGMVQDPFGEGVYAAADVICQFSHWEEVFGWMIAEGMAYAKPIVATRVGGIPELVTDGVTGLLVEPEDINSMADSVLRLIADRELRGRLGHAGRMKTEERFCLRSNVKQLLKLYGIGRCNQD